MNELQLNTSVTRYAVGDVDAWLHDASLPVQLVKGVALVAMSSIDLSYQLIACAVKVAYTAMALPVALWCALFSYEERLYALGGVMTAICGHVDSSLRLLTAMALFPLISSSSIHYSTIMGSTPADVDLYDEVARINSMPLCREKVSRFEALIQTQNRLENVRGDGNCGLRAIIRSLQPDVSSAEEDVQIALLREEMIAHMRRHRDEYKYYLEDFHVPDEALLDRAYDLYLARMAQDRTWIGNLELRALSEVLSCNIHVFSCDAPCVDDAGVLVPSQAQIFGSGDAMEPTARLYYDPHAVHYQVLRSI